MLYFSSFLTIFLEPSSALNRFILLIGLTAASFICVVKRRLAFKVFRLTWPFLLLVVWFWITSRWSAFPGLTAQRSITLGIVYFTAIGLAVGIQSPRSFHIAILWPACIVIMANIISLAFPETSHSDIGIKGIHVNKNTAGFFAIIAGAVIGFAFPQLGMASRFIATGSLVLAAIFLVLTESKTNLFVLAIIAVMVVIYSVLVRTKESPHVLMRLRASTRTFIRHRAHFILACSLCALLFMVGSSGSKLSWLGKLYGDPTLTDRLEIWVELEYLISLSPWKGFGYGAFWSTGQETNGFPVSYYVFYNDPLIVNTGHNGFLDILLQTGRPGLFLAFIVVTQAVYFSLILITSRAVTMRHKWTFCMLNCLIMMFITQNLTESTIFFPADTGSYIFLTYLAQLVRWRADLE